MKFEVRNGSFSYEKENIVLNNISFTVKQGEIISILGPNGAGKTTLLKCMLGFESWKNGSTLIDDININQIPTKEIFKKISYVPQVKSQAFPYTVFETVLLGRSAYLKSFEVPHQIDEQIALQAIKQCGIEHLKDKHTNQISGGEFQLALIARALCTNPEMIVLDEPETGLDYSNQLRVLNLLNDLSKQNHKTIIFNTHYPDHALDLSDKTVLLQKDGTCMFDETKKLLTSSTLTNTFGVDVIMLDKQMGDKTYHSFIPIHKGNQDE